MERSNKMDDQDGFGMMSILLNGMAGLAVLLLIGVVLTVLFLAVVGSGVL